MSGRKMSLEDFLQDETLGGGSSWAVDDFDITDIVKSSTPTPSNRGFQQYESDYSMASYDDTMVLFNNLPNDADEELIDELFKSRYFKYKRCKLFRDPQRSKSKIAIAWLLSPKDMDRVLKWNSVSIDGVRVNIKYCDKRTCAELEEWNEAHPQVDIKQMPSLQSASLPALKPIAKPKANPFGNAKPVNAVVLPVVSENTTEIKKLIKDNKFQPKILKKEKQVKEKSNPFGNAKPVDTLSRQVEIDRKLQLGVINSTTISTKKIHDKEKQEQKKSKQQDNSGRDIEKKKEVREETQKEVKDEMKDEQEKAKEDEELKEGDEKDLKETIEEGENDRKSQAVSGVVAEDKNGEETGGNENKKKLEKKKYEKRKVYKKKNFHTNEDRHYKKGDEVSDGSELDKSYSKKKYTNPRRSSANEGMSSEFGKLDINASEKESKPANSLQGASRAGKEAEDFKHHPGEGGKPTYEKRKPFHRNRRASLAPNEHEVDEAGGSERRKPHYKSRRPSVTGSKSEQELAADRPGPDKRKPGKQAAKRNSGAAGKSTEPSESNGDAVRRRSRSKEAETKLDTKGGKGESVNDEGKPYHKQRPFKKYSKPKANKEAP